MRFDAADAETDSDTVTYEYFVAKRLLFYRRRHVEAKRRYNHVAKKRQVMSVQRSRNSVLNYRRDKGDAFRIEKYIMETLKED